MQNSQGRCWPAGHTLQVFILGLCLVGVGACGSQDAGAGPPPADATAAAVCAPGDQKACACPGGMQGAQRCNDDGRAWGECLGCPSSDPPDAGAKPDSGVPADTVASSDAGATTPADSGPTLPSYVNIDILSALLGPSKSDGTSWDESPTVPSSITDGLALALEAPGTGPILNFMASAAVQALSKPDPIGGGQLDQGTGFDPTLNIELANETNNTEDTFEPTWPGPPGWRSVRLSSALKLRMTIRDEDLVYNDDVGVATVTYADVVAAWIDGRTYWVRVDSQTNNQLLAVAIQVTTAASR